MQLPLDQVGSQDSTHLVPLSEPETKNVLQLLQTDGAEVQGLLQGFTQAECPLHEATMPIAIS